MQQHQKLGNPKIADSAVRNKRGPSKATPVKSFFKKQFSAGSKFCWTQKGTLAAAAADFCRKRFFFAGIVLFGQTGAIEL